jgi:hypothetical protein
MTISRALKATANRVSSIRAQTAKKLASRYAGIVIAGMQEGFDTVNYLAKSIGATFIFTSISWPARARSGNAALVGWRLSHW